MSTVANSKVLIDPSLWVIDDGGIVSFRYRIVTNDFNIRSAKSPTYSIKVPPATEIFTSITGGIFAENVGTDIKDIRLSWSVSPDYDNLSYYVFVKKPNATAFEYYKTITDNASSYLVDVSDTNNFGTYEFKVSLPTVDKKVVAEATLLTKSIVL